jgi:plastocyanin
MNIGRALRIVGAIAIFIGGLIHLQLYFKGYRSIHMIGRGFLINAISSGVVAAALVCRREWFVKLAGVGVAAGTIGAFIASRQGAGLFDFREHGLQPSPQAIMALVVEGVAIVALLTALLPFVVDQGEPSSTVLLGVSTATAAVVLLGLGAYWAGHYHATIRATASSVSIADFAFAPSTVSVSKGTTVTWTNADTFDHSIAADDHTFRSDSIGQGASFQYTFATDGTFSYHCGIHPSMSGSITVTG